MSKLNLKAGDILYVLPINNAARYNSNLFEVKIKSFGKKLVNVEKQKIQSNVK